MIEVFRTTVQQADAAHRITQEILFYIPGSQVSFDLEDCDSVLRIEGDCILNETIISLVNAAGYECEELP